MRGSFVISNKVAWRFNGETYVKQSVKVVSSPEKWTLRRCLYGNRNKFLSVYMVYLQGISH